MPDGPSDSTENLGGVESGGTGEGEGKLGKGISRGWFLFGVVVVVVLFGAFIMQLLVGDAPARSRSAAR